MKKSIQSLGDHLNVIFAGLLACSGIAPCVAGPPPLPLEARIDTANQVLVGQITQMKEAPDVRTSQGVLMGRATANIEAILKGPPTKTVEFLVVSHVGRDYGGAAALHAHREGDSGVWLLSDEAEELTAVELLPAEREPEVQRILELLANRRWSEPVNGLRAWAAVVRPDYPHANPVIIFAVNNASKLHIYVPSAGQAGLISATAVDPAGLSRDFVIGQTQAGGPTAFCQKLSPGGTLYLHPDHSFIDPAWRQNLSAGPYSVVIKCRNEKEGEAANGPGRRMPVAAWKGELSAPPVQLVVSAPGSATLKTGDPAEMNKVRSRIEELNKEIIPAVGTPKAQVDAVYGVPREIKELKGKGSRDYYPMHTYELLPPPSGQDFRAFLYVTYRDDKVRHAGINHMCVTKNRADHAAGSPEDLEQKNEITAENIAVLADLKEIRNTYAKQIATAWWNRENPGSKGL